MLIGAILRVIEAFVMLMGEWGGLEALIDSKRANMSHMRPFGLKIN
jgi:hypothetical protein